MSHRVHKINGHEVSYYVDHTNRIVGAVIKGCKLDVSDYILDSFKLYPSGSANDMISMPDTIKCIARCHPDDVFDVEVGMRIASKRLRVRYWQKYHKRLANFVPHVINCAKQIAYEDLNSILKTICAIDPMKGVE